MIDQVIIRPEAEEELGEAYLWYENQRSGLGDSFLLSVDAAIEHLRWNAAVYAPVHGGLRRLLMRRFPYAIYYVLEERNLIILSVFHGSRDPKTLQGPR